MNIRVDTPPLLRVDAERLWASLMRLAGVGAFLDARTGLTGVSRQALTEADAEGRRLVISWMEQAGLRVTIDELGSIFGRREGLRPELAPVMAGSHLDTVATAGAFDGCLGVLGALEAVRALNDAGIVTARPIVVAAWTEEEGVRFGVDMLGSAVATGRVPLQDAYDLVDAAGVRLEDELRERGFLGSSPVGLRPPSAYLECHIEQGPVLCREGLPIGVVSGVPSISWQRVRLHGRAAHAGATPTELRVDPTLAAAELILQVRRLADSGEFGQLRGTVGRLQAHPGMPNVIADAVELTVDLRNPDDAAMVRAESALAAFLADLPGRHPGLRVEASRMARTVAVAFDQSVQGVIGEVADALDLPWRSIVSGAGHDAQELATVAPTAMIFVRGQYEGISHNPREYSTPEDCARGVDVLVNALVRLAQ